MVGADEVAGSVADGRESNLIIDSRLQQGEVRLSQFLLRVKHEKVGVRTQLKFPLVRSERLLREIKRGIGNGERQPRRVELIDGVANLPCDEFLNLLPVV